MLIIIQWWRPAHQTWSTARLESESRGWQTPCRWWRYPSRIRERSSSTTLSLRRSITRRWRLRWRWQRKMGTTNLSQARHFQKVNSNSISGEWNLNRAATTGTNCEPMWCSTGPETLCCSLPCPLLLHLRFWATTRASSPTLQMSTLGEFWRASSCAWILILWTIWSSSGNGPLTLRMLSWPSTAVSKTSSASPRRSRIFTRLCGRSLRESCWIWP